MHRICCRPRHSLIREEGLKEHLRPLAVALGILGGVALLGLGALTQGAHRGLWTLPVKLLGEAEATAFLGTGAALVILTPVLAGGHRLKKTRARAQAAKKRQKKQALAQETVATARRIQQQVLGTRPFDFVTFGPEQWKKTFNVHITTALHPKQVVQAVSYPFHPQKNVGNTHMLVWIPKEVKFFSSSEPWPLSIMTLRALNLSSSRKSFLLSTDFQQKQPRGQWLLITRHEVPGTAGLTIQAQQALLQEKGYRLPTAIEAACFHVIRAKLDDASTLYGSVVEPSPQVILGHEGNVQVVTTAGRYGTFAVRDLGENVSS